MKLNEVTQSTNPNWLSYDERIADMERENKALDHAIDITIDKIIRIMDEYGVEYGQNASGPGGEEVYYIEGNNQTFTPSQFHKHFYMPNVGPDMVIAITKENEAMIQKAEKLEALIKKLQDRAAYLDKTIRDTRKIKDFGKGNPPNTSMGSGKYQAPGNSRTFPYIPKP